VLERWCVCTHLARQTAHPFALIDLVAMKAGRAGARLAEIRAAGNSTIALDMILQLYLLGGLRRSRRGMLRHAQEQAHLAAWLAAAGDVPGGGVAGGGPRALMRAEQVSRAARQAG
jgi:hypothetical protein